MPCLNPFYLFIQILKTLEDLEFGKFWNILKISTLNFWQALFNLKMSKSMLNHSPVLWVVNFCILMLATVRNGRHGTSNKGL